MVMTNKTQHVYPFHWDVVTRAFWNKYPNKSLAHVERVDVLDRFLDDHGRLVTTRLAKVTQMNVPGWVRSALGDSTYVFEETLCDPQRKELVLKSTNLSLRSVAIVEETCVYSVYQHDAQKTLYEAEAKVTAFVPFLSKQLEKFSINRGADTAAKGIRAVEEICNDIFQGTFQPACCDIANAAKDSSTVNG
ncbi:ylr168c-like protein [Plasmopara halstedii]|uniref:Ylr168c-like protein n=1 Tax=Plasmopara halstedii TaxID=4781 RepID=A0A0P1A7K1_PLAHL|nr:ylr168c-like protein [Plasmopara halstedii]CEG36606.1 ylr168c-like protein [Plasmopara halstedii]|eukprot:XP_024572975.1 ylr168c-like protein [Plasmopara halstedii]